MLNDLNLLNKELALTDVERLCYARPSRTLSPLSQLFVAMQTI